MVASKFRYMLLVIVLTLYPFSSHSADSCDSFKATISAAISAGFMPVFTAKTDKRLEVMLLTDASGRWVILGIDENNTACAVAQGDEMQILIERVL